MKKHRALIFGTSRIHRPFAKRADGAILTNEHPDIEIVFPKIGYFHTAAEIAQAVEFLLSSESIPFDLWKYVFRIEPRSTTPKNEFNHELERCIREGSNTFSSAVQPQEVQSIVIEISSLSTNKHVPTGCFLHTNPNFIRNASYSEIYPEGYYQKFEPTLPVEKSESTASDIARQLQNIKNALPEHHIYVLSHLRSTKHPNTIREKIHQRVLQACDETNCSYIDIAPILNTYGFAETNGQKDIHHLSKEGEDAVSELIYTTIKLNEKI